MKRLPAVTVSATAAFGGLGDTTCQAAGKAFHWWSTTFRTAERKNHRGIPRNDQLDVFAEQPANVGALGG
jgi:hypothetical protein